MDVSLASFLHTFNELCKAAVTLGPGRHPAFFAGIDIGASHMLAGIWQEPKPYQKPVMQRLLHSIALPTASEASVSVG